MMAANPKPFRRIEKLAAALRRRFPGAFVMPQFMNQPMGVAVFPDGITPDGDTGQAPPVIWERLNASKKAAR